MSKIYQLISFGLFGLLLSVSPAWAIETGITIEWKAFSSPSYSVVTATPLKLLRIVGCYDVASGELLDCPFTYGVLGLKPPPELLDNNGGHNHNFDDDTRPLIEPRNGKLDVKGGEFVYLSNLQVSGLTRKVNVLVIHTMPQVAGKIQVETFITAPRRYECVYKCWTETSNRYLGTIDVGIRELQELMATESDDFVFKPRPADDTHPSAHSGTGVLINGIKVLSKVYKEKTSRGPRITDMSLPKGGVFDLNNQWFVDKNNGHVSHRTGHDVDFSKDDDGGQSINCFLQETDEMQKAFKDTNVTYKKCYKDGHYHVRFK